MGEKREIRKKTISFSLNMDRYRNMDVGIKPNLYAHICTSVYLVIYYTFF